MANPFGIIYLAGNLKSVKMSNSKQDQLPPLKKCQDCRKMIHMQFFEEHKSCCRFGKVKFECVGCGDEVDNTIQLLSHLQFERVNCRKAYSKTDFVQIFEFKYQNINVSMFDIKSAYNIMEKTGFKAAIDDSTFCNSCGKTFGHDFINDHFSNVPKCKPNYRQLSHRKCEFCSQPYTYILLHLQENPTCKSNIFQDKTLPSTDWPPSVFSVNNRVSSDHEGDINGNGVLKSPITNANILSNDRFSSVSDGDTNGNDQVAKSPITDTNISTNCEEIKICFGCGTECKVNTILKHLRHHDSCKNKYPVGKLEELRNECKYYKDKKRRLWNDRRSTRRSKSTSYFQLYEKSRQQQIKDKEPRKGLRSSVKPLVEDIDCKACHVSFPINIILKHLAKKEECKELYSSSEFKALEQKCKKHVEKVKNYSRRQVKIMVFGDDTEENLCKDLGTDRFIGLGNYRELKNKLKELHLKCFFTIDLERILHYKWEIHRIRVKNLRVFRREKFLDLKNSLAQIITKLENLVEDRIKEIKDTTTKWCFHECSMDVNIRKLNASNTIKSKCESLQCKVEDDLNTMLTDILNSIREILYISGLEVTKLEISNITINEAELTSKGPFIMNEIRELISK